MYFLLHFKAWLVVSFMYVHKQVDETRLWNLQHRKTHSTGARRVRGGGSSPVRALRTTLWTFTATNRPVQTRENTVTADGAFRRGFNVTEVRKNTSLNSIRNLQCMPCATLPQTNLSEPYVVPRRSSNISSFTRQQFELIFKASLNPNASYYHFLLVSNKTGWKNGSDQSELGIRKRRHKTEPDSLKSSRLLY